MLSVITLADGSTLDVSAFPLPPGVEDGLVNRSQLARAFSVSENTITKWMGLGMPAENTGQNGVAYEFRISHCYAWKASRDAKAREEKAQGDRLAQQAAMAFRGLDEEEDDPSAGMSPSEIKAWAEAEYVRNRAAEQRGDLIRADRMRALLEELVVAFGNAMDTLPDFAEAEFGLTPEQVQKLQDRCDQARIDARQQLEKQLARPGTVATFAHRQQEMEI